MTTVVQLLNHAIKAAGEVGQLQKPIPSLLIKARNRIEALERQLAGVETMRDRIALKLLPGCLIDDDAPSYTAVERAYALADRVLEFRANEPEDLASDLERVGP